MLKPFPSFASDEEAEDFVASADLTEYDWTSLRRTKFAFAPGVGVSLEDVSAEEPSRPADEASVTLPTAASVLSVRQTPTPRARTGLARR